MKTRNWLWLLLAAMVCTLYACSNEDVGYESSPDWATEGGYKVLESIDGELTKEDAWEIVKDEVFEGNSETVVAYVSQSIVKAKSSFETVGGKTLTTPNYDCWMFLLDDNPGGSLSRIMRYVFLKTNGGYIKLIKGSGLWGFVGWDPILMWNKQTESRSLAPSLFGDFTGYMNISQTSTVASNRYAIIIGGGMDSYNNHYRYWNNCSAIYNVLRKKYGYPKDNIKTFISDGYNTAADRLFFHPNYIAAMYYASSPTDLDQDGVDDLTGAATLSNIRSAFSDLRYTLTSEDELLIFITSHGATDGGHYATLWGERLYADELNEMLVGINTDHIQILNTVCYSGGFISELNSYNRVIGTACRADESSYPYSTFEFDAFPYYWISGLLGKEIDDLSTTVNCDLNNDNKISFYEAFAYAEVNARANVEANSNTEGATEHAQYLSNPTTLGARVGLENLWFDTSLVGDSYFCNQAIYNLSYLPNDATVTWNVTLSEKHPSNPSELTTSTTTHTGNTLTLTRQQDAAIYDISATISYNGMQETLSKTVLCNGFSPYTGTLYWESGFLDGNTTYNWIDGGMELYLDQAQDLTITQHIDRQGTITNNPNIKNVMSPDLDGDIISGNTATLTFGFSGEGDLEVTLYSGCNDDMNGEPFLIPYIVFDPNSYSLQLDESTSTLNIASQTTTYGLRNENPIRTIEVRTYDRQTLLTFNVEDDQTNVADIDVSTLSPGTYILKVTDDTVHYLKLVI